MRLPATIRIDAVRIRRTVMPCKVHLSTGSYGHYDSIFVGLCSRGTWGWGELVSSGDPNLHVASAQALLGKNAAMLDHLLNPAGANGGNEVLSQALHDLVGRTLGLPAYQLEGGATRTRIPVIPCLFPESPEDAAAKARGFVEQGYRGLKFKTYGTIDEDLAHLRAIRAVVPREFVLQTDANRGYKDPKAFAETCLQEFANGGIDIFEDPVEGTLQDYAALRGKTRIKIMIDIAARSNDAVRDILLTQAADIVNQHPNHQGGYARSRLRGSACELFGTTVWMGGTGYAGVGVGHWLQLAANRGLSLPVGELGGWIDHGFAAPLLVDHPIPRDGIVELSDAPGCGVELDEVQVARFANFDETHR